MGVRILCMLLELFQFHLNFLVSKYHEIQEGKRWELPVMVIGQVSEPLGQPPGSFSVFLYIS